MYSLQLKQNDKPKHMEHREAIVYKTPNTQENKPKHMEHPEAIVLINYL